MSQSPPKPSTIALPSLLTVAKSYSPGSEDLLMIGNTIITPAKRTKSPASVGGQHPGLGMSPSRVSGTPQYVPRLSLDPGGSLEAAMKLQNPGSPRDQPNLLGPGQRSHNRLASSPPLDPYMMAGQDTIQPPMGLNLLGSGQRSNSRLASSPPISPYMIAGQDTIQPQMGLNPLGYGQRSNSRLASSPPLSPFMLADRDTFPGIIRPSLNSGAGFHQPLLPGYMRGPVNRLDDYDDLPEVGPAVHNYLDKQNQLMVKIMKDVQDFKTMEAIKQKMLIEQQFGPLLSMPSPSPMNMNPLLGMSNGMNVPMNPSFDGMGMGMGMGMLPPIQPQQQQLLLPNQGMYQSPMPMDQMQMRKQTPTLLPLRTPPQNVQPQPQPMMQAPPPDLNNQPPPPAELRNSLPTKADNPAETTAKKRPMKKANKIRGRRNLRSIGWTLALPGLWFISVVKWAEKRRATELKALEESVPEHLEKFLEFSSEVLEKEIKTLATDKSLMVIVQPPKTDMKLTDMDKRCKAITDHLVTLLDSLSLKLDSGKLPKEFFQFLSTLSEDDAVLPENFLSGFEMEKLSFNMFGNLKYMNEWRSKMILGSFILIKGLLYFLIMRSWTVINSIPEKNVNLKNMINVGSVFYHVLIDIFSEKVQDAGEAEAEPPFKPLPTTFSAVDPGVLNKLDVIPRHKDVNDTEDIIAGFYERDQLISFFDDRPSMMKEVREAVLDFLDVLYELTHNLHKPKAHVKEMFTKHRPK